MYLLSKVKAFSLKQPAKKIEKVKNGTYMDQLKLLITKKSFKCKRAIANNFFIRLTLMNECFNEQNPP